MVVNIIFQGYFRVTWPIEFGWRIYALVNYWFRWWLDVWLAPVHYLNPCWNINNWTPRKNFFEILIKEKKFSSKKMYLKISSENWWPSSLGLNVLTDRCGTTLRPIKRLWWIWWQINHISQTHVPITSLIQGAKKYACIFYQLWSCV